MSDTVEKALRLAKSINAEGKSSGGGAWTRKEGKNPEGGLNEKGRASLRAQGHDIKRPQPEGGSRRDSFCARMKGMKAKLTSKETANDPDSRINKSLRKWNCADGGKVWDKPRPDDLGKPKHLSSAKKAKAKAMAKAAGRPYPNLVDNMRAAKADGGSVRPELGAGGDAVKAALKLIDSPSFRKWFGQSKAVDEAGNPLRLFHGTRGDFSWFDPSKASSEGGAFYFSRDAYAKPEFGASNAASYASGIGGNIMPVHLKMENPLITGFTEELPKTATDKEVQEWIANQEKFDKQFDDDRYKANYFRDAMRNAKQKGHDSVIIKNVTDDQYHNPIFSMPSDIYSVFNPTQIKSATGNIGTFDPHNPDIRYADGGKVRPEMGSGGDAVKAAIRMIRAYHGSPHKFDKFDISKMGTGEGAQAYGHGLYFADKEDVARSYRDALAAKEATIGGSFDNKGHMYEVNLHTDPEHLLDWDKPLSEQKAILDKIYENLGGNNKVKELNNEYENLIDMPLAKRPQQNSEEYKFLENRYNELQNHPAVKLHETLSNNPDVSGKNFYYRFGGQDPEQASIKLKNVGIPGIKYLDQGSRGAGEGSSNYVMFDPNNIEILRRYKNGGNVDRAMSMIKRMHREDGGFNPNDYTTLQNAGLDVRGPNEAADLAASYASMQGPQSDDAQIRNYEEGMREFQRMTPEQQQMSHAEAVPMRPVSINAPAFGGVKHIGDAPYNVAEPLSTMAQTAYGMKTMPLYQTPLAPVARAIDAYETAQELRKNPSLGTAASHAMSTLWPVGGKAGAALAGAAAGAGLMGQESAEAVVPTQIAKTLNVAKGLPKSEFINRMVSGTPGARLEDEAFVLPVFRKQKPQQALEPSVRGGVFYLPQGDRRISHNDLVRKRGGKVDAALRLADQRIASASGGKSPPQKVPNLYENLDKFYKEETGQIQPKHLERDWRYNILPEEYKRGNLGSGQYALANGGKVKRHGYADGGQPGQAQGQFNPGSYISNVYNQFANRAPNQSETNFWQGQMNQGSTPQQVYQGIANDAGTQAGYYGQYNAADPNSFNTMLNSTYQSYLGRAPNASDTAFWQGQLAQGSTPQQIVQGIANDQAARNYAAQQMAAWGASGNVAPQAAAPAQQAAPQSVSNTGVIGAAYNQYLGRAPTQDEVNFWQGELNKGVSPQQIMQGISSDASVRQSYANQYNPANQSTFNNLLNSTYQAYLGRAPNESDIAFWQGELNKGVSPQQIVSGIANDQASKNFLMGQASQFGPVSAPSAAPSSAPSSQPSSGQADPETSDAISAIYNQYMGRSPTSDEVNYWSNELAKGKSFADFSNVVSNDLSSKNYANNQFIIDEYQGLLGRDPNSDELNYWQGQLNKGSSRAQIDAAISSDPGSQAYQASNFAPYQVASSSGNSGISSGPRTAEQANASVPRSSQELQNHFGPLEQAYGLPTGSLMAMSKIESEYGTNQHRAGSQYKGMMQLGNDIVKKYNVKNVYDWRQNSDAAAQYMRDNAKEFVDKTGTQPQIGDFYGMHQQGATGWSNMVSKPNDLAYKTVGLQKVLQNVPAELASKAKSLTNAQFREFFNGKIEQGLSGPDGKGRDVLFGGASSAPPAPPPMIPTGVGESGTGGIFPSGGIAGLDSSLSGFTPISGSGGVDYTAPATPMASYTPPAAPVAPSISHTPSVSHTGGGGSHTVSHGSGSVSFAPPASSGGGSGTIDPYFGHAGSTHYDPRYGNGVGGGADWEWDYAKKRGGKISDKKDMKVYSRPAGGSHNRGAKAVKDALRLARK